MSGGKSNAACSVNVKGLDQLVKALKQKPPVTRVGVLGGKATRNNEEGGKHIPTNAEIGAAHEFGKLDGTLPERSFLRVPITENLEKYMEKAGALDKQVMKDTIKAGTLLPYMRKIAVLAENIVSDAFDSAGFGKWPGWKDPNYTNNANQILVDTKQLRESITSEVVG